MTADAGAEPTFRRWDHYLGPREPRLFAAAPPPAGDGRMAPGRPELL
jgi:hypothetical protein